MYIYLSLYIYTYLCAYEHSAPPPTVALSGSQAFGSATAFNAAIGAWNTASVTSLAGVCAVFGTPRGSRLWNSYALPRPAARHMADAF